MTFEKLFILIIISVITGGSWWNYLKHKKFTWLGLTIPRSFDQRNFNFCMGVGIAWVGTIVWLITGTALSMFLIAPGIFFAVLNGSAIVQSNRRY